MTGKADISLARAYDGPDGRPGARLLVDRVWPRGRRKEDLRLDDWIRDVAPGTALRKWFGHDPAKWAEFRDRYRAELDANRDAVERCLAWCRKGPVVLIYGAKDRVHNQAVVLRDHLQEALVLEKSA
ncbi:MAG: DUF488 family protein [Rhodobacter sp.]|jgi:uncharacterized protein YeaO (DUF488 family)|nr:DUF488 family protein [Rhodobacter sp.]